MSLEELKVNEIIHDAHCEVMGRMSDGKARATGRNLFNSKQSKRAMDCLEVNSLLSPMIYGRTPNPMR